jgi:hypothetical protein
VLVVSYSSFHYSVFVFAGDAFEYHPSGAHESNLHGGDGDIEYLGNPGIGHVSCMFEHKHLSIFFRQRADGFKYLLVLFLLFYVLKEPVGLFVALSISHFVSQRDGPLGFLLAVAQGLALGEDGQPRSKTLGLTQGVDFVYDATADVLEDVIDIIGSMYDAADERL